jgi:hypothetical protein
VDDPEERAFLTTAVKKQVKYGSTASHVFKPEKYLTHYVQPGDTLQGLALRYGTAMEHIKRANKLWTADSLFLRPTLNIPISETSELKSPEYSSSSSQASTPQNGHNPMLKTFKTSLQGSDETSLKSSNGSIDGPSNGTANGDSRAPSATSHKKEESIVDFLSRIDSSISKTKDQVMQQEDKLSSQHSESDLFQITRARHSPSTSYLRRQSFNSTRASDRGSSSSLASNGHAGLGDIPLVVTNTRKVKSSRRKLELVQDDMFEL